MTNRKELLAALDEYYAAVVKKFHADKEILSTWKALFKAAEAAGENELDIVRGVLHLPDMLPKVAAVQYNEARELVKEMQE